MADSSCQFNSIIFFYSEQNRVSAVKRCRPARAVAQPQIENNIRLDAVFKKAAPYCSQACRSRRQESFAVIAASLLSSTLLTTGTSLLNHIPRIPFAFFAKLRRNRAGVCSPCIQLKGAVLKAAGYFIKSIYYPHSSVPTILSNYFTCFDICIAVALEADGGEFLRGSVIAARQQLEAVGAGIFLQYSCAKISISRATSPAILGTDIDLRYLGHIFVVAERFFQLNADEAGEPSSVAVRNDDNLAPVCKKRGANAFLP